MTLFINTSISIFESAKGQISRVTRKRCYRLLTKIKRRYQIYRTRRVSGITSDEPFGIFKPFLVHRVRSKSSDWKDKWLQVYFSSRRDDYKNNADLSLTHLFLVVNKNNTALPLTNIILVL